MCACLSQAVLDDNGQLLPMTALQGAPLISWAQAGRLQAFGEFVNVLNPKY